MLCESNCLLDCILSGTTAVPCAISLPIFAIGILDNDECFDGIFPCHSSEVCTNTPGSYRCECATGQKLKDGICQGKNVRYNEGWL